MTREELVEKWLGDWIEPIDLNLPDPKTLGELRAQKEQIKKAYQERAESFQTFLSSLSRRELAKPYTAYLLNNSKYPNYQKAANDFDVPRSTLYRWKKK